MSWLVTGGSGYIGAHVVDALSARGEQSVVLDDFSTGEQGRTGDAVVVEGSILDQDLVRSTIKDNNVRGIIHIAAKKQVGESVADPLKYYRENVAGTIGLLQAAVDTGVESFVFSSSAATYGMPADVEIVTEDAPTEPLSPYGTSKLIGEWAARDVAAATGLRVISLRYFNVAGAARPELGDPGVFNLIPMAFERIVAGEAPRIFGDDYPTPDGTCVRDYISVVDIAEAHVAALEDLVAGNSAPYRVFNIGRGQGSSVREVLDTVAKVTGNDIKPVVVERRPGDPARIVASADRIRSELGWTAKHDLEDMVASAWAAWQHRH